jgi:hypothetical protein
MGRIQLEENYETTLAIILLLGKGAPHEREGNVKSFGNEKL